VVERSDESSESLAGPAALQSSDDAELMFRFPHLVLIL
jgi:hypothetical protein